MTDALPRCYRHTGAAPWMIGEVAQEWLIARRH
jgi:hypothetical protein